MAKFKLKRSDGIETHEAYGKGKRPLFSSLFSPFSPFHEAYGKGKRPLFPLFPDVIAPTVELSIGSIASFQQAKQGEVIRIHPMLANIVPPNALEQLGLVRQTEKGVSIGASGAK